MAAGVIVAVDIPTMRPLPSHVGTGTTEEEPAVPGAVVVDSTTGMVVVPAPVASPTNVIVWFPVRYVDDATVEPSARTRSLLEPLQASPRVPDVVTGDPEAVNNAGAEIPTLETVPAAGALQERTPPSVLVST